VDGKTPGSSLQSMPDVVKGNARTDFDPDGIIVQFKRWDPGP
jgi:hypothetical protein